MPDRVNDIVSRMEEVERRMNDNAERIAKLEEASRVAESNRKLLWSILGGIAVAIVTQIVVHLNTLAALGMRR